MTLPQKNGHRIKTPSSKLTILVSSCWKKNCIRNNAHNFFILSLVFLKLLIVSVAFFLGHPVYVWCTRVENWYIYHLHTSFIGLISRPLPPPPPPTDIEPGGTHARSRSPEPPYIGKRIYPLYLGYWLPWAITKNTPFSGLSREISPRLRPKYPPFPRKWECACGPLMHSSGGGGGGAGLMCINKNMHATVMMVHIDLIGFLGRLRHVINESIVWIRFIKLLFSHTLIMEMLYGSQLLKVLFFPCKNSKIGLAESLWRLIHFPMYLINMFMKN